MPINETISAQIQAIREQREGLPIQRIDIYPILPYMSQKRQNRLMDAFKQYKQTCQNACSYDQNGDPIYSGDGLSKLCKHLVKIQKLIK